MGSNERKREGERERGRERDMGVCFFLLFIFMGFTTQGGSTPEYRYSSLLHTNQKRIKGMPYIFICGRHTMRPAPGTFGEGFLMYLIKKNQKYERILRMRRKKEVSWMYYAGAENRKGAEESY
jgi:hypothetical protein